MPDTQSLQPDLDAARRFLEILDETAETFVFQTFDDLKSRKDKRLAAKFFGHLDQCTVSLLRLQRRGAGVFVTVNETDGKGRKLENITRIRAIWHEEDTPCGKEFPLEPHMIVESSPGKFHRYWLVDGLEKDRFAGVMERMIRDYGSDPNVKDIARVLRVPGFFHQKDPARPFQVRLVHESGVLPYSAEEILKAFPPLEPAGKAAPRAPDEGTNPGAHRAAVTELASRAAKRTHEDPSLGRHAMVLWLGRECAHRGIPADWAGYAVKVFGSLMRPTDTTGKAAPLNVEAETRSFCDAHAAGLSDPPEKRPPHRSPPRPPDTSGASRVVDFRSENEARLEYERRIAESEEFDQLVYVLAVEIDGSSMKEATKAFLLKKIAGKVGVSVSALRADTPKRGGGGGDGDQGSAGESFIDRLNERHAVVYLQGQARIMNLEDCPIFNRPYRTFSGRQDFLTRYENRFTRVNGEDVDWGTAWLKSPDRREYRGIVFAPGQETPADVFNLWQGFGIKGAMVGSCQRYLDHVRDVICNGDDEAYAYVWSWMAYMIQKPADLPGTALVLRGAQGTGKNTFADVLGVLVNPVHYVQLTHVDHLAGKFNGHLSEALLVFANEATWGGDKQAEGTLKAMITDETSLMEEKHRNAAQVKNYKHLILASNEDWVVPRGPDCRRFVVLDVSDEHKEDYPYFDAIKEELRNGGYETLMYYLEQTDLSGWHPRMIPPSLRETGWDLKLRSGGPTVEWWFELLDQGWITKDDQGYGDEPRYFWPETIPTDELRDKYNGWCQKHRIVHIDNARQLGIKLAKWGIVRTRPGTGSSRPWVYRLPSLDDARRAFSEAWRIPLSYWGSSDAS